MDSNQTNAGAGCSVLPGVVEQFPGKFVSLSILRRVTMVLELMRSGHEIHSSGWTPEEIAVLDRDIESLRSIIPPE